MSAGASTQPGLSSATCPGQRFLLSSAPPPLLPTPGCRLPHPEAPCLPWCCFCPPPCPQHHCKSRSRVCHHPRGRHGRRVPRVWGQGQACAPGRRQRKRKHNGPESSPLKGNRQRTEALAPRHHPPPRFPPSQPQLDPGVQGTRRKEQSGPAPHGLGPVGSPLCITSRSWPTPPVCPRAGGGGSRKPRDAALHRHHPAPTRSLYSPSPAHSRPLKRIRAFCPQLTVVMLTPRKRAAPGPPTPPLTPASGPLQGPQGRGAGPGL